MRPFRGIVEQSLGQEEDENLFLVVHGASSQRHVEVGAATAAPSPTSSSKMMSFNTGTGPHVEMKANGPRSWQL